MGGWDEESYCDGCHRGCHLSRPRCNYGVQQARELEAERAALYAQAPACPGCHCGCSLADPQCGRGGKLAERWMAGEELPQRRMPPRGQGGPRPGGPRPDGPRPDGPRPDDGAQPEGPQPVDQRRDDNPLAHWPGLARQHDDVSRLSFLLPMGLHWYEKASMPFQAGRFLGMLHMQGDWMKLNVLGEKARMQSDALYPMLDNLIAEGYLIREYDTIYITEAGVQRAEKSHEQTAKENAQLLDALDAEELATFEALWERLIGHWVKMSGEQ